MRQKSGPDKAPAEQVVKDIRRATRRHFSAEDKIRIVLEGLRGEESIAELCRREGIASSMIGVHRVVRNECWCMTGRGTSTVGCAGLVGAADRLARAGSLHSGADAL